MSAFKKNAITFGITFCISFLVFGIVAYIIMSIFFGAPTSKKDSDAPNPDDMVIGFDNNDKKDETNGRSFTFLLVGTDYQPRVLPGVPSHADSIVFVRFSCETNQVVYMSIPSTLTITADGTESTLCDLYSEKGIEYLVEKVQGLTGININYYAIASITMFDDIINTLGEINYNVPINMNYSDPTQNLYIEFEKGEQKLNGAKATDMLRYRSDSFSDRMTRNVDFLKSIMSTFTAPSYRSKAPELFGKMLEYIVTNFTEDDLLKYMDTIYNYASYKSSVLTYPGNFKNNGDGNSYFVPDTDSAIKMMAEYKNY